MPATMRILCLEALGEREIDGLSDVLIDCVEGGASVSFMWPMSRAKAEAYWRGAAAGVTGGDAERLYARNGWQRCGEIPNYALWPDGRLCATTVFYKFLA